MIETLAEARDKTHGRLGNTFSLAFWQYSTSIA